MNQFYYNQIYIREKLPDSITYYKSTHKPHIGDLFLQLCISPPLNSGRSFNISDQARASKINRMRSNHTHKTDIVILS